MIRVFKKDYDLKDEPDLNQVISEVVEFYAHCVVRVGVKLGYWEKAGRVENKGEFHKVIFRCKMDYGLGNANFKGLSHHWEVWNLEDYIVKKMDKLEKKYYAADIGPIIPPKDIVYRMKTGEYDFIYPSYED